MIKSSSIFVTNDSRKFLDLVVDSVLGSCDTVTDGGFTGESFTNPCGKMYHQNFGPCKWQKLMNFYCTC